MTTLPLDLLLLAGSAAVLSISVPLVSRYAATLRSRGQCAATIALRLQQLKTALGWAVRQGFLVVVPPFPVVKVPRKLPQPVPPELFERLLQRAGDPQMRAFLLAGWLAGLRLEEAFALRWEETRLAPWLNSDARRIIFPAGAVKGASDQWVPLDPALAVALEGLPRQGPTVFRFTTRKGRPISCSGVGWRVVRLARQAGVRLSMRSLRRGFVSRYAARFPAQVVQRLARHADIKTTLRHYCYLDDAVEEAVFGSKPGNSPAETASSPGK